MGRPSDAGKEQRWLDHVHRWQNSQLTVREFCRRHRLREANFYTWRRVLRQRGLLWDTLDTAPAFAKVTVDAEPAPATPIEIVLGERVLRVRTGFDTDLLLQLVQLLEEQGC